jgi:hypothetical protein
MNIIYIVATLIYAVTHFQQLAIPLLILGAANIFLRGRDEHGEVQITNFSTLASLVGFILIASGYINKDKIEEYKGEREAKVFKSKNIFVTPELSNSLFTQVKKLYELNHKYDIKLNLACGDNYEFTPQAAITNHLKNKDGYIDMMWSSTFKDLCRTPRQKKLGMEYYSLRCNKKERGSYSRSKYINDLFDDFNIIAWTKNEEINDALNEIYMVKGGPHLLINFELMSIYLKTFSFKRYKQYKVEFKRLYKILKKHPYFKYLPEQGAVSKKIAKRLLKGFNKTFKEYKIEDVIDKRMIKVKTAIGAKCPKGINPEYSSRIHELKQYNKLKIKKMRQLKESDLLPK